MCKIPSKKQLGKNNTKIMDYAKLAALDDEDMYLFWRNVIYKRLFIEKNQKQAEWQIRALQYNI